MSAFSAGMMLSSDGCYASVVVISLIGCCRIKAQLKPPLTSSPTINY
ncbi:MAG: hypothetical protein RM022_003780 [Nostoc sp. EfeVER01]|nr:hypothetical protein [Nostoc sp. EfeVER01]MDZ7943906.1 hypothetical protein [Nostoc sp. EfeVER01]